MIENAAIRSNFVGDLYCSGVEVKKSKIIRSIPFHELHQSGALHIHDLEAFGEVYNCSIPIVKNYITNASSSNHGLIMSIFEGYKELIIKLGAVQSGGIGFANFDIEISTFLKDIVPDKSNISFLHECIYYFIRWINLTDTRYGREPYYLTFNLGLSQSIWGREVTLAMINTVKEMPFEWTRPNIVYKVGDNNICEGTINNDLYLKALECTAKRMIPTYLLLNSPVNINCVAEKLAIMGCRTRVYQNMNGEETSIGRGNIGYVTLNLPQLAIKGNFNTELESMIHTAIKILDARSEALMTSSRIDFIFKNNLWDINSINELVAKGTLSIGFVGLSEAVEILTGEKMYQSYDAWEVGFQIVKKMREIIDTIKLDRQKNYSLLATSSEMVAGRFSQCDSLLFGQTNKGYYTNSFHVEVNSGISILDKISYEAPFHALCNGGSISYIEFGEAPLSNIEALSDAIQFSTSEGISYLGFNFPLDICMDCGSNGTFDKCPSCNGSNIKRIRRVSGYLEDLSYFTEGKKIEEAHRKRNI